MVVVVVGNLLTISVNTLVVISFISLFLISIHHEARPLGSRCVQAVNSVQIGTPRAHSHGTSRVTTQAHHLLTCIQDLSLPSK